MRAPTSGVFFDGMTSARHVVSIDLEKANLMIRGVAEPFVRTRWPYGELEQLPAPEGVVRLAKVRNPVLARLEIRDSALAAEIAQMTAAVMHARKLQRRARARVFIASVV